MKVQDKDLQTVWNDLEEIFLNYKGLNKRFETQVNNLGFELVHGKGGHVKMYMCINQRSFVVTFSATPSDKNAGRQILRDIRRYYEGGK